MNQNGRLPGTPKELPPEAHGGVLLKSPEDERVVINQVLQAGKMMATWPNVGGMLPLAVETTKDQPAWQRNAILSVLVALAEAQVKIQQALSQAEAERRGAGGEDKKPGIIAPPGTERAPTCAAEIQSKEREERMAAALESVPEPVAPATELHPKETDGSQRNEG